MAKDLHELPKLRDSISYVYLERAIIEQENASIIAIREGGRIPIPIAATTCLLLGPGTSITHAAIRAAAENGCMVEWCGDRVERFYAAGLGETRNSANLLRQAKLCMDSELHLAVVRKMYDIRFPKINTEQLTLEQIRGLEGIRVKESYKLESKRTGVKWTGRQYKLVEWEGADDINRALSQANAILYSICQGAIISLGYSPGLGFIHTGKMMSFVYDIADLYKTETTIPAAFEAVRDNTGDLEAKVRLYIRQKISRANVLKRIAVDISRIFSISVDEQSNGFEIGYLWNSDGEVPGGINYYKEI